MRYYDIKILNPSTNQLIDTALSSVMKDTSYTSFLNNQTLPGALNIELDIPVSAYNTPRQGAYLRIWGLRLEDLGASNNLSFAPIEIRAGMQKGLPLATPDNNGLLVQGTIYQAFGNWVGTSMTLDFVLVPAVGTPGESPLVGFTEPSPGTGTPANLQFNWAAGQQLSEALTTSLTNAYGQPPRGYKIEMHISDKLVGTAQSLPGTYQSLTQLAVLISGLTRPMGTTANIVPLGGGVYMGVRMTVKGKTIIVYDQTEDYNTNNTFDKPKEILFRDMIGQPTWISPATISFKVVMRGDLWVGDYIKMPEGLSSPFIATSQAAAVLNAPSRNQSAFKGKFFVVDVHHFGNFRQADAASWVTVIEAQFVSFQAQPLSQSNPAVFAGNPTGGANPSGTGPL